MIRVLLRAALISSGLLFNNCKTPSIVATQAMIEGNMANNQNHYEEAIIHYEQYLHASSQLGLYRDESEEARVCRNLAHAYATQGKFNKAELYLKYAIIKDSVSSNRLAGIEDCRALGELYAYRGDYESALQVLMEALRQNQGMESSAKNIYRASAAATDLSISQVQLSMGNFREAESFSMKALSLYSMSTGDHAGEIEAKLILGIIAREKNNLALAEARLTETLDMCKRYGINSGRQHQALSEVYWLRGDIENTIRHKLIALEEAQKTAIKPQLIIANMRLGDTYQKMGDPKKAASYYEKAIHIEATVDTSSFATSLNLRMGGKQDALDVYSRTGSSLGKALVSVRLGDLYAQKGIADSARYFYTQAQNLFEKIDSREGLANTKLQLSKLYVNSKDLGGAKTLLRDAKSLTIQAELLWQIYLQMGTLEEALNNVDSARVNFGKALHIIADMRRALTIDEFKTIFANTKVEAYDKMIQILMNNQNHWPLQKIPVVEEAFYLAEQSRARTFLDMMGNRKIDAKSTSDSVLLENEQDLRLKIQELNKDLVTCTDLTARALLLKRLHIAQQDHEQIAQQIKLSNPAYASMLSVEPQKIYDLQKELDSKSALLEYWVGDRSTIIWVITGKNINAKVVAVTRKALLREVQGCRNGIAQQSEALTANTLADLHKLLIQPVLPFIKGITNLIVVPHSSLHFLPFQALQAGGRFLVEDYNISYAPSASVWFNCIKRKPQSQQNLLAMSLGDQAIAGFNPLPGTAVEIQQIGKVYNDSVTNKTGKEFTETYFKTQSSRYNYIHLATHGAQNKYQPLYSYLLMNSSDQDDGQLTVEEIYTLNIQSKLVILSACETALGELGQGDDLMGLSRAFMYAGAPAVVVSLWKVDDATTAWLMTRFYEYLRSGQTASASLTFAQRDLINFNFVRKPQGIRGIKTVTSDQGITESIRQRKGKATRIPFYWAPFILVGNSH